MCTDTATSSHSGTAAQSLRIANRIHAYEVHPRKDKRGVDLISDVLPFGRLWYTKPDDAVSYTKFSSFPAAHIVLWFAFMMWLAT